MIPPPAITFILIRLLASLPCLFLYATSTAGTFIFAAETGIEDLVTHPTGYTGQGQGGTLTVRVCIDPNSANAAAMVIPVQNNISIYNQLQPTVSNLASGGNNNIPSGQVDFESVALHEIGHCIGMAHVNAASESGLTGNNQNFTKATKGNDNQFNISTATGGGPGIDGIIGSHDDSRGDDVNLHWYRKSNNNPFSIASTVDSITYARDLADLQLLGHSFATNADRTVASTMGYSNTEAVMQQLTFFDEAQRTLTHDDVATLLYAASGKNEVAGNNDDYTINLEYGGLSSSNCDINLDFDDTQTGFAVCQTSGQFLSGSSDHLRITSANIYFNTGFNWFFNTDTVTLPPPDADNDGIPDSTDNCPNDENFSQVNNDGDSLGDVCDPDDDNDGLSDVDEDNNGTDPFLADTDGDGLADGAGEIVPLAALPGGIDADGDGFVDGEQDLGTDPLVSNVGDLAPRGTPNDSLDAGDLVVLTRLVTGVITPTALESALADINGDTQINVADLLMLQQALTAP